MFKWLFKNKEHQFNFQDPILINGINRCSSLFNDNYVEIPFQRIEYECLKCKKRFTEHEIKMFEFNHVGKCKGL